jgi:hypothetical protein
MRRRLLAQGDALGSGINRSFGALKGRSIPPPFQGGPDYVGRYTRGVAPGWHPPRRWRDIVPVFSRRGDCKMAFMR